MLAVRTPGAPQTARIARPLVPPSPLRDRVSYSDHDRFRGYFPVHFIPAYNLPVYASQWPLPEHHARLGTRLLARLYRGRHLRRQTSTRLQGATRTDPYEPNSGIRLVWGFLCQGGVTPFCVVLCIPFFCSTRAASILPSRPHISIAVARSGGQGRRFFSAAEGLSLTDASTAAGCRRSGGWPRDDPRGACHWPRSIARTTLVFG